MITIEDTYVERDGRVVGRVFPLEGVLAEFTGHAWATSDAKGGFEQTHATFADAMARFKGAK
jgi:hypothetical protein